MTTSGYRSVTRADLSPSLLELLYFYLLRSAVSKRISPSPLAARPSYTQSTFCSGRKVCQKVSTAQAVLTECFQLAKCPAKECSVYRARVTTAACEVNGQMEASRGPRDARRASARRMGRICQFQNCQHLTVSSNVTDIQSSGECKVWISISYKHCIMCSLHQKPGSWPLRCWDAQRDCCMPSAPGAFADILGPIHWLLPCAHVLLPHSVPLRQ